MQEKKETYKQLLRRLKSAVVLVEKTKETESVFFDDKGLRITVNDEYAVVETGYHSHVFSAYFGGGVSKPWLFMRRLVKIALECECNTYSALLSKLKEKEDKGDYNFVYFVDWWLFNIYHPLYTIGNTDTEFFLVYEEFMHNVAKNSIILEEKESDMTNKDFVNKIVANMREYMSDVTEVVLFKKETDEEITQQNIEALMEQETNNAMEAQINESKD